MALVRSLYNAVFRRTSTFVLAAVAGGVVFERFFDKWIDDLWENQNQGVS